MDELSTPRLRLRRARPDDLAAMHAVLSHPQAMRYWSTPPHDDLEQTRVWLGKMIAADPAESDDFVIEFEGRVIGKAGFHSLPDLGYILHPDGWGQGIAREAVSAVIARVFDRFPLDEVVADVDPRNEASLRLLARLGFVEVRRAQRTWKVGEEWCDSVYLALTRDAAGA